MEQVTLGVIGAGRIAHVMCDAYAELPQAKLLAVTDVNRAAADTVKSKYGMEKVYATYEELLADDAIHAVVICTPTPTHAAITIKAAEAGKHIFCQKPMALTLEDCDAMVAAVKNAGVVLQIGFMLRFTPPFGEAKKWLDEGEIGDVVGITSSLFGWVPSADWFYDPKIGGGVLIDSLSHTFDLFRWYNGDFATVYASGGAFVLDGAKRYGTADNVMAHFRFRNGTIGNLYGSWTSGYGDLTVQVYGTNGTISIDLMEKQGGSFYIRNRRNESSRPQGWSNMGILWKYGYQGEARHFINTLLGKAKPMPTGEEGREAIRALLLASKSMRTGKIMKL
ncbi:Gfo/Idh/MocA family protein [Mesorhizobium sp. NPDC059025]|uniref:Gfo/Idh/MocA family protein n=1 Tax=unclassified Mesorhizobium TaxID=325217 RepID=UPI0036A05A82